MLCRWPNDQLLKKNNFVLTRVEFGQFCSTVGKMQQQHSAFADRVSAISAADYMTASGTASLARVLQEMNAFITKVSCCDFCISAAALSVSVLLRHVHTTVHTVGTVCWYSKDLTQSVQQGSHTGGTARISHSWYSKDLTQLLPLGAAVKWCCWVQEYPVYFAMLKQVSTMLRAWAKQHSWLQDFVTKRESAPVSCIGCAAAPVSNEHCRDCSAWQQ